MTFTLYLMVLSVTQTVALNVRIIKDNELERIWKETDLPHFKVLSLHVPGETGENHEESHSGQSISDPRFEPDTSGIPSRSIKSLGCDFSNQRFSVFVGLKKTQAVMK